MNNSPTQLFTGRTTNGQSGTFKSFGGFVSLIVAGTFSGGTVTVQVSPDNGTTWVDSEVTLTAAGIKNFISGEGLLYRISLASAASPNLNAWVAYER